MANVQHATLTDPELHEPKGAAAASANTVYVANGAASGAWSKLTSTSMTSVKSFTIVEIPDISEPYSVYVPFTKASVIEKVTCVLEDSISASDATITFYNDAGVSMGSIVVAQSGSAPGDIDVLSSLVNNSVDADSYIRITTDGASTTVCRAQFMIEFTSTL